MKIPSSTYRVQLHPSFRFNDLEGIVPYLKNLGVSDIYTSPILESKTGSWHGYDLIDFRKIDRQLGGEKSFYHLAELVKKEDLGWLQDIVPNHMAYHPSNPFLFDVLEKGRKSVYGKYFDITWQTENSSLGDKLLFPFLEKPLIIRLVDPDNRDPVDYNRRSCYLDDIKQNKKGDLKVLLKKLLEKPSDGKIKLFLIHQLLQLRNKELELFREGSFTPLSIQGRYRGNVIAYLREYQDQTILIVLPRFCTAMVKPGEYPLGENIWQDTSLKLPVSVEQTALDWISQEIVTLNGLIPVGKILKHFPVSVILIRKRSSK